MAKTLPIAKASVEPIEDKDREKAWRTEEALRDLERAEKHRGDKDLMRDVKKLAKDRMKCLGKI